MSYLPLRKWMRGILDNTANSLFLKEAREDFINRIKNPPESPFRKGGTKSTSPLEKGDFTWTTFVFPSF
jgi:hypothetical protein